MREKFARFMSGRYGADQLSRFMVTAALVIMVINLFLGWGILSILVLALLVLCYFRMFSRNYQKRYEENLRYTQATARYRYWLSKQKDLWKQRKVYHIYRCPSCKQKVRVPRGKGKIIVTCPKCHTEFQKRS